MRTRGVRLLDPVFADVQVDWLMVSVDECRDDHDERQLISKHFRKPHESWCPTHAYVSPVDVRRSRRRILFVQWSGLE
jgi:hypothetical protein